MKCGGEGGIIEPGSCQVGFDVTGRKAVYADAFGCPLNRNVLVIPSTPRLLAA